MSTSTYQRIAGPEYAWAAKNGAIMGVIFGAVSLGIILLAPGMYGQWWFGLSVFFIECVIMVLVGRGAKDQLDGYINYVDAFLIMLVIGFVGYLAQSVITYGYLSVDKEAYQTMVDAVKANIEKMMTDMNAPQEVLDQQLEALDAQFEQSPMNLAKQLGGGFLSIAIVSLLLALFVRKKKPEFV